jgi:outer membrane immunogenic protein
VAFIESLRSVLPDKDWLPPPHSSTASDKLDWFGTVRGRLGITPWGDNALLYATGGLGSETLIAPQLSGVHTGFTGGGTFHFEGAIVRAGLNYHFNWGVRPPVHIRD